MMNTLKDIENVTQSPSKPDEVPFLPQYGAVNWVCKKKKCCRKYKSKGKHCGGCPKK
jgi:hypothetical protein